MLEQNGHKQFRELDNRYVIKAENYGNIVGSSFMPAKGEIQAN
jgi:hypothetical protein